MKLRNFAVVLLFITAALLPFHTFLMMSLNGLFFNPVAAPPYWLAAWKEILLVLFAGSLGILVWTKKVPWPRWDELDMLIIIYVLWALLTGIVRWETDILRIVWGAKYSLFFLVIFLLARHFPFTEAEKNKFFRIMLGSAALVIFFAVLQYFLPADFLVHFGYSPYFSDFHPDGPISYCQKISFTDTCRAQSFLSGPNQLGAYLLFILPLYFFWTIHPLSSRNLLQRRASTRALGATFFLLGLAALFLAYSRAAWGGLAVALGIGATVLFYKRKWFRALLGLGAIGVAGVLAVFLLAVPRPYIDTCQPYETVEHTAQQNQNGFITTFFCKVVYRASSTQGHLERSRDGVKHIMMHPLGTGLGDSGPASARFYENGIGFIPESWYLQVGIDTGFPGLILFLAILFVLGKKLLATKKWEGLALFCGLLGLSIMALKLHAWESADVAYLFWAACGVFLALEEKKGFWEQWEGVWKRWRKKI